jgi:hypothetical protein
MQDSDDEVRDRATMYYLALTSPAAEALLTPGACIACWETARV